MTDYRAHRKLFADLRVEIRDATCLGLLEPSSWPAYHVMSAYCDDMETDEIASFLRYESSCMADLAYRCKDDRVAIYERLLEMYGGWLVHAIVHLPGNLYLDDSCASPIYSDAATSSDIIVYHDDLDAALRAVRIKARALRDAATEGGNVA